MDWSEYLVKQEAPQERAPKVSEEPIHASSPCGYMKTQNWAKQAIKSGTLYRLWSAAAEEHIVKSSVPGTTKS